MGAGWLFAASPSWRLATGSKGAEAACVCTLACGVGAIGFGLQHQPGGGSLCPFAQNRWQEPQADS